MAPRVVAAQTKKELSGDGFWALVDRLRQGRRLVITGDHGYADASNFSNEEKNEDTVKLLRSFFGASRCAKEDPAEALAAADTFPRWSVGTTAGWLVMGQRKWTVQGGFPQPVPPRPVAAGSSGSVHRIPTQVDCPG